MNCNAELIAHIEALNAERQALMDADPDLWCSMWCTDPEYIADLNDYGVFTGEDFDRMQVANNISDCSKAAVGSRQGVDWKDYSLAELNEILDGWVELANAEYQYEVEREQQEEIDRENLAVSCHVSVEQIIEWESSQDTWYNTIDREFIESIPVEPYEEAHYFELGKAA